MGIFSRPPHPEQDRHIEEGKRLGAQISREIYDRLNAGTATPEDKRIFNAGRRRSGRIK